MKISTFNIGMPKLCIPQKLLLVVKITVLLFFVAVMHVSASSYAQNINLSATNAPLKKLFKEIRKQSGYNFIYTEGMMKDTRPVNIHVSNASIDVILDKVFHDQPLSYTISNNTIVIKEKDNQLTSNAIITITGTIKDEKGEPLPGVTVAVEGVANATSTDYNGKYTIKANAGQTLVFSFIGYKTVKRIINNESLINVSLEPASRDLTEVVVVGYGTQKRSDITGAVASVPKPVYRSYRLPTYCKL
jgi:hypothetical protein